MSLIPLALYFLLCLGIFLLSFFNFGVQLKEYCQWPTESNRDSILIAFFCALILAPISGVGMFIAIMAYLHIPR